MKFFLKKSKAHTHTCAHIQSLKGAAKGKQKEPAMHGKPTWKMKLFQVASILRHSDGDYKNQLLIEIKESSLCMVCMGANADPGASPPVETAGRRGEARIAKKKKICSFCSH